MTEVGIDEFACGRRTAVKRAREHAFAAASITNGAAANLAAIGVAARNGEKVTFMTWLRYGLPMTVAQLAVSSLYVLALFALFG